MRRPALRDAGPTGVAAQAQRRPGHEHHPQHGPPGGIRYQPDESPPAALSFGLGLQLAVLTVAVQRVSWRRGRALDFRAVQGSVNVEGIGNLVCGAAGTVPNTSYSVAGALTELAGVAARAMGVATTHCFFLL